MPSDDDSQFPALIALQRKVEVWWIVNVQIPTNPDYDRQEIDEADITPGALKSLQMLIDVATGKTELLEYWQRLQKPS